MAEVKKRVVKKVIKKKPMRYRKLFKVLSFTLLGVTLIFLIMLLKINVLGFKYMSILIVILALVETFLLFIFNKRFKLIIKIPFVVFSILLICGLSFGIYNINLASEFAKKIVSGIVSEEHYSILCLKESTFTSIKDISKTKLGIYDNGNFTLEDALISLKKQATFDIENYYDDLHSLLQDSIDGKIDVIFISSSLEELLGEEYPDLYYRLKSLGEVTVSKKVDIKKSNINITKEPFLVYISGIDTYGSIGTVSRSDVNILVAINPKTSQILLVNTPRDYYVKLHSKKAMDKLTHAGIYGVEESMNTLGDLYASEVDFYVKLNFSSLVKIVDTLGGITVDSKYDFSYDGFEFHKGINNLSGYAALAFSRCRKELPLGDISRGENQEAVIKGLIEKICEPSIITKYQSLLETLGSSIVTNMSEKDMFSLAKFQLNENLQWNIESKNAKGTDAYKTTYSAGKTKLYVMDPDEFSVTEVKNRLNEILEES